VDATEGGESAVWSADGKTLSLNLAKNTTYTEAELDKLIAEAKQEDSHTTGYNSPASVELNLKNGTFTTGTADVEGDVTVAGKKASADFTLNNVNTTNNNFVGVTGLKITANKYGDDNNVNITIKFDGKVGEEEFENDVPATYDGTTGKLSTTPAEYTLTLATGKEYTEKDIEKILAEAGFSATVEFKGPNPDEANTLFVTDSTVATNKTQLTGGQGLGDTDAYFGEKNYDVQAGGQGVTLQVGANYGQTIDFGIGNMSSVALGVDGTKVDVSTQAGAQNSIENIDAGIAAVSKQRSLLGAIQNRLEHTISNLDNTAENLQAAESGIRDVDMAAEMVQFSKNNILQQAAQSMLAQANQANQGVLSLLG
jgi:flagellin